MFIRVLLATLLGAIIAYAFVCTSWMVLPYHGQTLHQFKDEQAVVAVIKANATQSGVYHYPYMGADKKFVSKDEEKKYYDEIMVKMGQGPNIFVNYAETGRSMMKQMAMGFGLHVAGALLLSLLMLYVACSGFFCRFGFAVLYALSVGLMVSAPNYIWWQFDCSYMMLEFFDFLIAWSLAGFVIALIIKRSKSC